MFDSSYAANKMLWLYYVIAAVVNTQQSRSLFIVSHIILQDLAIKFIPLAF